MITVDAELPSRKRSPPRLWTVFLILVAGIAAQYLAGSVIGGFFTALRLFHSNFQVTDESIGMPSVDRDLLQQELLGNPNFFLAIVAGSQLALLAVLVAATCLSKVPWKARLNFGWGDVSLRLVPLWCLACLGCGVVGDWLVLVVEWLGVLDPSKSSYLETFDRLAENLSVEQAVVFVVLISVLPGFVEEMFFRGYIQTRLVQRWPPWKSVSLCSFIFAAYHIDPLQSVALIPLALWLGFLAYRVDGILPSITCHLFNNFISALLIVSLGPGIIDSEVTPGMVGYWIFVILCLTTAVVMLLRTPLSKSLQPIRDVDVEEYDATYPRG